MGKKKKKTLFRDSKSNGPQYSKVITFICIIITIFSFLASLVGCIVYSLPESVAVALITASGGLGATSVVWNLKKSQAENTIKLYVSSYKEILEMKKESGDLEFIDTAEQKMINNLESTFDISMEEATTTIEKQELIG
jgi:hypothetical protein